MLIQQPISQFPILSLRAVAKSLGNIYVYVHEILRRYAPLDDNAKSNEFY